jgi:hypothetical protein
MYGRMHAGGIQMFRQKKKGSRNKPDNVIFAIFAIFVIFNVSIFQCYYIKNSVEKLLLLRNSVIKKLLSKIAKVTSSGLFLEPFFF